MNEIFTNTSQFLQWSLQLTITLIAIGGLIDRMVKRLFKRYFKNEIEPIAEKLEELVNQVAIIESDLAKVKNATPVANGLPKKRGIFR